MDNKRIHNHECKRNRAADMKINIEKRKIAPEKSLTEKLTYLTYVNCISILNSGFFLIRCNSKEDEKLQEKI